jgi:hypothetical protein
VPGFAVVDRPLCTGITAGGKPCTAQARRGDTKCRHHAAGARKPSPLVRALARDATTAEEYRQVVLAIARAVAAGEMSARDAEQTRLAAREAFDAAQPKPAPPPEPTVGPLLDLTLIRSSVSGPTTARPMKLTPIWSP